MEGEGGGEDGRRYLYDQISLGLSVDECARQKHANVNPFTRKAATVIFIFVFDKIFC